MTDGCPIFDAPDTSVLKRTVGQRGQTAPPRGDPWAAIPALRFNWLKLTSSFWTTRGIKHRVPV